MKKVAFTQELRNQEVAMALLSAQAETDYKILQAKADGNHKPKPACLHELVGVRSQINSLAGKVARKAHLADPISGFIDRSFSAHC